MVDAFLGDTPRLGQAFAEGGGSDDGEWVAVGAFPRGRREMSGAVRGGLDGFQVVGSVVGIGFGVGGEMIVAFLFIRSAVGGLVFIFLGQPADWGRGSIRDDGRDRCLLLETAVGGHDDLFLSDGGSFLGRHDHLGGFVGDERVVLGQSRGRKGAGQGVLGDGGGGSDWLLDHPLPPLDGGQVGDIDEFGAAIGNNGHGDGDLGGGIRLDGREIQRGFIGRCEHAGGGFVLELVGSSALCVTAVWTWGRFLLTGHVPLVEV